MEKLPADLYLKIFNSLDHHSLAVALQVSKKWKAMASENGLWCNLFRERWGGDRAAFFAPDDSRSWKDVYEVQDRCDRIGLGLKLIREGLDYYIVHKGEIQRYLGSKRELKRALMEERTTKKEEGILDKILFIVGDMEVAATQIKRIRN
ncbi:uncharacterized protein LOC126686131 [Mercurialis annua]|uniref:uncharacterized protein LOC126686131 n=1 Tax=Mercurialis annua TaxID=3986 RepID=UPI00215F6A25|nr:uncharacterized protein LOC126686131 [Mercurialis annua]